MTKKRITPFNEAHALEYGLEIASRSASTKQVDSVRCKFCIYFGKEGRKASPVSSATTASARKRKVTENIKYFTRPFRVDNYKSHLKTHSVKWAEYQPLSNEEKKAFFEQEPEKFVNTLDAHFDIERKRAYFALTLTLLRTLLVTCYLI